MLLNVAPRRADKGPRVDNDGERLLLAEMPSGMRVLGVDAGHAFAFLAEAATELRAVDWPTKGSQFRSRDLFPEALALLHAGRLPFRGEPARARAVLAVPAALDACDVGLGHVRSARRWGEPLARRSGEAVGVEVGGPGHAARVGAGSFGVEEGGLAVAPGSSGYPLAAGGSV